MNVAFFVTCVLCTIIGGCGYYMFGSAAKDVVIFNLPSVRALMHLLSKILRLHNACAVLYLPLCARFTSVVSGRDHWQRCVRHYS